MNSVGRDVSTISILLLAATLVTTPCSADTLNVLASFFSNQSGSGHTLFEQDHLFVVPRFDPALGTLDAISIVILRGAIDATVAVDNESAFSPVVFADEIHAVEFTELSYSGGSLVSSSTLAEIGPSPGVALSPDARVGT